MDKSLAIRTETGLARTSQASNVVTAIKLAALQKLAMQNFAPNDELWITESGEFEVPYDGVYEILAIDGGNGGVIYGGSIETGASGAYKQACAYFYKGQKIAVKIGAGGIACNPGSIDGLHLGSITSVGDIDFSRYVNHRLPGTVAYRSTEHGAAKFGGGFGGGAYVESGWWGVPSGSSYSNNGEWPGAGGGCFIATTGSSNRAMGNGAAGAVRLRFFNPAKANMPVLNEADIRNALQVTTTSIDITSSLDSTSTTTALSALAGKMLKDMIDSKKEGNDITILDDPIDFENQEQIDELVSNVPVGHMFLSPYNDENPIRDESVFLNSPYNTEEIITESGDYVVPVTGWYEVILIGGGEGCCLRRLTSSVEIKAGNSGEYLTKYLFLEKDDIIPVTIGSGGKSVVVTVGASSALGTVGGVTSFGDLTTDTIIDDNYESFNKLIKILPGQWEFLETSALRRLRPVGGGFGGSWDNYFGKPTWYGAGGGGFAETTRSDLDAAHDGYQGAVILHYCDPAKDKNIPIDTAGSVTMKQLADEIEKLKLEIEELKNGK